MLTLKERESVHIIHIYDRCGHNISLTARVLGVGRTFLYMKLEELVPWTLTEVREIRESKFIEFNI